MIDLRRADGSVLPYRLSVEPEGVYCVRTRVIGSEDDATIAEAVFSFVEIPLTPSQEDVQSGSITLGYEPHARRLLIEFGEEPRLAMLPAGEIRSALNVCRLAAPELVA